MPIYTYKCTNTECNHEFTRLRTIAARKLNDTCDKCSSTAKYQISTGNPGNMDNLGRTKG